MKALQYKRTHIEILAEKAQEQRLSNHKEIVWRFWKLYGLTQKNCHILTTLEEKKNEGSNIS